MSDIFENIAKSVESEGGTRIGGDSNQKLKWKAQLLVSEQGAPKPLLANAITMLRHSPDWSGVIRFDDFASQIVLAAAPPWDTSGGPWKTRLWTSNDDIRTADWLQQKGIAVNVTVASQAATAVADDHKYHPVLEYLDKLRWDKVPRLDKWITKCLGGADNVYHSDIGRCSLIAAIARIREQ
jgi:putative DNA primase/helicase